MAQGANPDVTGNSNVFASAAAQKQPAPPRLFRVIPYKIGTIGYVRLEASVNVLFSPENPRDIVNSYIKFYFVPDSLAPIDSLVTPLAIANAFAKSTLIFQGQASRKGGAVIFTFPEGQLPAGSFFATVTNPFSDGLAESAPAGPINVDPNAVVDLEASIPPGDVTVATTPILSPLPMPRTDLLYWNVVLNLVSPAPTGSFDGLTVWVYGYFFNATGVNQLVETGYYKYTVTDPQNPALGMIFSIPFLADYDTTSLNPVLNIAHPVTFYFVAESKGRTYQPPVTSRPSYTFVNGIGV